MSHWNFRIVHTHSDPYFDVKEVFYNDDGTIAGYADPCLGSEYAGDVINNLRRMVRDIERNPDPISKKDVVGFNNPVPF